MPGMQVSCPCASVLEAKVQRQQAYYTWQQHMSYDARHASQLVMGCCSASIEQQQKRITCLVSLSGSDQNSVMMSEGTPRRHSLLPRTSGNLLTTHTLVVKQSQCVRKASF